MRIIDNFFKDPYEVRSLALKSEYFDATLPGQDNAWPGYRSNISPSFKEGYLGKIKSILKEDLKIDSAYFQWVDKSWVRGSAHFDFNKYTIITFLNLDPSSNSGTEIYNEKRSKEVEENIFKFESWKRNFYRSNRDPIKGFFFGKRIDEYNSQFKDPCVIANKFNRTVIFDSNCVHAAQNFFGNNIKDSRLTLISFLD